jgi:hypothetical protein
MDVYRRGFVNLVLLLALVLLIAGGVGYWTTMQKPQVQEQPLSSADTADLKTYRNEKFGFEFKYPADLAVSEESGENPEIQSNFVRVILEDQNGDFGLVFFAGQDPRGGPGEGWDLSKAVRISVEGKETEGTLFSMDESYTGQQKDEFLFTVRVGRGYDTFYSTFHKSQAESFIPRIESITETLKYTDPITHSTHPTIKAYVQGPSEIPANTPWKGIVVMPTNTLGVAGAPDVVWGDGTADPEFGGSPWQYDDSGRAIITHTYKNLGTYSATVLINGGAGVGFEQGTVTITKIITVR